MITPSEDAYLTLSEDAGQVWTADFAGTNKSSPQPVPVPVPQEGCYDAFAAVLDGSGDVERSASYEYM